MISFEYLWIFWLLPMPLLAFLMPGYLTGEAAVRIPRLWRVADLTGRQPSSGAVVSKRNWMSWGLLILAWVFCLSALARPQWIGEPITRNLPARDMLLAVDLSGSMSTEDFTNADGKQVNRLEACKQVLDEFLTKRKGDRVGLVFFGTAAFLQAPFTEDLELCRTFLDEAQVGMAGPQTVIGDAVGLSLSVFDRSEQEDRVLILLTDGNDTGSQVTPEDAAKIARDKGVTIHTIAVGDPTAVGEEEIDEEVLKEMARLSGGEFFRADDRDELDGIYKRLDEIETSELETESFQPKSELFFWPLAAFLLLGLGYHGIHALVFQAKRMQQASSLAAIGLLCLVLFNGAESSQVSSGFHFLRPYWLLAFIPIVLILFSIVQQKDISHGLQKAIAPHLLKHLILQPKQGKTFQPIHLLAITWSLTTIALAGPTWQRETSPFADDQAAVVFVQAVTPTMLAQDIQPSRLERSVHKIGDLLDLRGGTDAALIAYSGSPHLVMPLTGDAQIISSFASELSPEIMPKEGDAWSDAVLLADKVLKDAGRVGSIVLIADQLDSSQVEKIKSVSHSPIHILAIAGDQSRPLPVNSPPAPAIDRNKLEQISSDVRATLTIVSPDQRDVQSLSRKITTSFVAAVSEDENSRWKDMGYWLTPFILLISAYWFRRGWQVNG